jgi:four helix bundle protein
MIRALKNFRSYHLAIEFCRECRAVKLNPSLRDQLTRATESVVLTLAEGSAKPSARDRARYYSMSLGSFRESQAILDLAGEQALIEKFDGLGAMLYKLSRSASRR